MFGEEKEKEDDTLDPEEPVLADKRGVNAEPWHPAEMGAPYIYKVCLIGPCGAGKSAIANRLVAHSFDPTYRATRQPAQLFWRHTEPHTGHDIMVEIEDTPGVSGETVDRAPARKPEIAGNDPFRHPPAQRRPAPFGVDPPTTKHAGPRCGAIGNHEPGKNSILGSRSIKTTRPPGGNSSISLSWD